MAKIESRFREDSKIEYGNTLNDDKFSNEEFDVATANPPYGVDWKGYEKSIRDDKTGRFHFLPNKGDGQLLFMQHIISKLNTTGFAVVVHNGSSLFSGDAASPESNIRKWMLDSDLVEAVIQNPTSEFFNTGIYTYIWVINKNKVPERKDQILLIDASQKFTPLKKNRGDKRVEVDEANRLEIVDALTRFEDCEFARKFNKYHFYYNKQAIELTDLDADGNTFRDHLPMVTKRDGSEERAKSEKLQPVTLFNDEMSIREFVITGYDKEQFADLAEAFELHWKPWASVLNYKKQPIIVETDKARYHFDNDRESIVKTTKAGVEFLGCGKIVIKPTLKKKNKKLPERIEITVELAPATHKDYEIIPFDPDPEINRANIETFMAMYVFKPFVCLDNVVGAEINFHKIFFFYSEKINRETATNVYDQASNVSDSLTEEMEKILHLAESKSLQSFDTGIPWIGSMPEHWELKRVKDIFTERSEKGHGDEPLLIASQDKGVIYKKLYERNTVTAQKDLDSLKLVEKGDFVISLRSFEGGIEMSHARGIISSAYTIIYLNPEYHSEYFRYLFKSPRFIALLVSCTTGIREGRNVNYHELRRAFLPVPPLEEQITIAGRISLTNKVVKAITAQASAFKDLRDTLINDATTGKILVTETREAAS